MTFRTEQPPGVRGPDYHARVKIHGASGKVDKLLIGL